MIVWLFVLISAIAAILLTVCFGHFTAWYDIWKTLLSFACAFCAMNVLYMSYLWVISLFVDKAKPVARQLGIYRRNCVNVGVLGCFLAGVRVHVSGEEKLPAERFLMVSNHRSLFDPLCVLSSLGRHNISFVSKTANADIPALGGVAHGAGFVWLNREDNRAALKSILTAANQIRSGMCSMLIYPEGTRSHGQTMGDFHAGSFKIAQRASCPLVISCIRGSETVSKGLLFRKHDVYIDIVDVLPPETVKSMTTVQLADYSKRLMAENFARKGETAYA